MTAIIVLDNKNGLTYCNQRGAEDKAIYDDILKEFGKVYVSEYSLPLFHGDPRAVSPIPPEISEDDVLFLERDDVPEDADKLIVYRWDCVYPADRKYNPYKFYWRLKKTETIVGVTHTKIKKETYTK